MKICELCGSEMPNYKKKYCSKCARKVNKERQEEYRKERKNLQLESKSLY